MFSIFNYKKQSAEEKCNLFVSKTSVNHPREPENELLELKSQTVILLSTIEKC